MGRLYKCYVRNAQTSYFYLSVLNIYSIMCLSNVFALVWVITKYDLKFIAICHQLIVAQWRCWFESHWMSDERNDDPKLGWGCQSKMEVSKDTEQKKIEPKIFLTSIFFLILSPKKPHPNFYNRPLKINPFQNLFYVLLHRMMYLPNIASKFKQKNHAIQRPHKTSRE